MRILHISDLHLTAPNKTFSDVWLGVSAKLTPGSFDAIIISGDLTQRAAATEYGALRRFIDDDLCQYLTTSSTAPDARRRIIVVPGNHDVDWGADISERVSLDDEIEMRRVEGLEELVRDARARPDATGVRFVLSRLGHVEFRRVKSTQYASRFANLQKFVDDLYEGVLGPQDRKFNLLTSTTEHWSAHVFREHGVAIYGFNSCPQNDRYWTGAGFDTGAITAARKHADQHAAGLLRVAVWHHGLTSERGRPDSLTLQDLGHLFNAKFRVGFHGHTHVAEAAMVDKFLGDRFAVIATGSLGAGSSERPDAVGNQFTTVRLYPGQVEVQTYERRTVGDYAEQPRKFFVLREPRAALEHGARVERHERRWGISREGLARVTVTLERIEAATDLVLGIVTPPLCHVHGDEFAETPHGRRPVRVDELSHGRRRFQLQLAQNESVERCTWSYRISNSIAVTRADREMMQEPDEAWVPRLREQEEGRAHTVRFPVDQLVLVLEFEDEETVTSGTGRVIVDHRVDDNGRDRWDRLPAEEARCRLDQGTPGRITMTVEAPLVGHRYTVAFQLRRDGRAPSLEARQFARTLLRTCRNGHATVPSVRTEIVEKIEQNLASVVPVSFGSTAAWVGFLWNDEQRRLYSAFGRFAEPAWNARFAAGDGVAGHAFRFAQPAFWHRRATGAQSLIFRERTEVQGPYAHQYEWVACFPLLADDGAPIGVVSFAGADRSTPAEQYFDKLSETVCESHSRGGVNARSEDVGQLWNVIQASFWVAVAEATGAEPGLRSFAEAVVSRGTED